MHYKVIRPPLDDKLSNEQKTSKLNELDAQIADYELQRVAALDETVLKEKVLDTAMMFITNVDELWRVSPIEVRKQIQDLIFPKGVKYHFEEGFGTTVLSKSHQLLKKIPHQNGEEVSLVALTRIELVTLGL